MNKEQHTAIWKNIIETSLNRLDFLYEDYDFKKPTKSHFRDETLISSINHQFQVYTTIFDGNQFPPIFKIKNKESDELVEINILQISENKELNIYFDRVEMLIRKYLDQ